MQEVIVETILILAVMVVVVRGCNRFFGRKRNGCGCGKGSSCDGCSRKPELEERLKKKND